VVDGTIRRAQGLRRRMLRTLAGMACLVTWGLAAPPASAQFVGEFGRVANNPFSGQVVVLDRLPKSAATSVNDYAKAKLPAKPRRPVPTARELASANVRPDLDKAMVEQVQPEVAADLRTELTKKKFKGFGAYNPRINFAGVSQAQLFVGTDGSGFTLRHVLPGNSMTFKMTTPDVKVGPLKIGAPKALDPEFTVTFDLEMTVDVSANAPKDALVVGQVKVKLLNARLRPSNTIGDVLDAVNDVVSFLGGPNLIGRAQSKFNNSKPKFKPLDEKLSPVASALRSLSGPKVEVRPVFDRSRNRLQLELHPYTPVIVK
jgi:hypothetical protein